ncbi:hypothetical protein BST61_g5718 [Cercospora zeina]
MVAQPRPGVCRTSDHHDAIITTMRLLNISTLQFQTFSDHDRPPYAIASHRWEGKETTYREMLRHQDAPSTSDGYVKVVGFCHLVNRLNNQIGPAKAFSDLGLRRQCDWLWIDTACIDKQDGAELSESINSMFFWYARSSICYAYLADVKPTQKLWSSKLDLMRSQWFKRGWTLQELLAPCTVVFVANDWTVIGHKCSYSDKVCNSVCQGFGDRLNKSIAHITGIPQNIINSSMAHELRSVPVEEKLSWAKKRVTTRTEDQAYCLLGLLDVFIAPIYGEGENAWARLVQALEYKQALHTPVAGAKPSKGSVWFRLRGVKKEVKQEGRYASTNTMTTDVTGFMSAPYSVPPQRPGHSDSAMTYAPVSVPMPSRTAQSMGAISSDYPYAPQVELSTQSASVMPNHSAPPVQPMHHRSDAISAPGYPSTGYVSELRTTSTPQSHETYLPFERPTAASAQTKTTDPVQYWGIIEEEDTVVPLGPQLKHRYGSGWSFHDTETGYNSQWFHELEDTSLTVFKFQPAATAVTVKKVVALYDFVPYEAEELAFKKGDTISVVESVYQDWWKGSLDGRVGIFPLNYVEKLDPHLDDSRPTTPSESGEVSRTVKVSGPANISILAEGSRPGLDDWLKYEALSPGLVGDFQWQRLSTTYLDAEAELINIGEVEARSKAPEDEPAKAAIPSWEQSPASAQLGRRLINDSVLGNRSKPIAVEQPVSPVSVDEEDDQDQQLITALATIPPVREHDKQAPQELFAIPPATFTAIAQPTPQRKKPVFDFTARKVLADDNDGDSIQAEDFWAECWRPPVLTRVTTLEQTKQETNVVTWSDEPQPQSATVTKQVTTNTTVSPPMEIPETISIPTIVLKALLDQQPRPVAGASNETELLANTAVDYIRTLLLSQAGPQKSLQAKQSGVVESREIKTAKYEATSVMQMVSATATNVTKGERVVEVNTAELPNGVLAG